MKNPQKNPQKKKMKNFFCEPCSYSTTNKKDFFKHKNTTKHFRLTSTYKGTSKKIPSEFLCEYCGKNYKHRQSLFNHKKICNSRPVSYPKVIQNYPKVIHSKFECLCGKSYKYASGLSKHKKKCFLLQDDSKKLVNNEIIPSNNVEKLLKNIMLDNKAILEENRELKEQMKNIKMGDTYNTTNNNQKLSINIFLNEKCKNAMSLNDFVDNIKLSLKDLEFTNKHGYVEGISNIFIKNLNDMDVTKRPIHCSDQKRLQFYVKKEDKWEKDKQNEEIDKSIEKISNKQIKRLTDWTISNPDYETNPQKTEEYYKLVRTTMGVNFEKNLRKVKKMISDNVKIEKNDL